MPERLLQAVQDLTETVKGLESALTQYPKRTEVERKFATKHESKQRAKRYLVLGLAMTLISLVVAYFVTISTVVVCFISDDARSGAAPQVCHRLPGYSETQEESQELRKRLIDLLEKPDENSERLDKIENELAQSSS
jgi:hypothetical protein